MSSYHCYLDQFPRGRLNESPLGPGGICVPEPDPTTGEPWNSGGWATWVDNRFPFVDPLCAGILLLWSRRGKYCRVLGLMSDIRKLLGFWPVPLFLAAGHLSISVACIIEVNDSTDSAGSEIPENPSYDRMEAIAYMEASRTGGRAFWGCVTCKILTNQSDLGKFSRFR